MKATIVWCLLVLGGGTLAQPTNILDQHIETLNHLRNVVENGFLDMLEELRDLMLDGSNDLHVLDPFYQDKLLLDLADLGIGGHLIIRDLVVTNLSTFVVDNLQVDPLTWRLDFDVKIPILEILAENYDLWVRTDGLLATGNGPAIIQIKDFRIVGTAQLLPSIGNGSLDLQIKSCHLTLHVGGWKSNIENLLGEGPTSRFFNQVLGNVVPDLVEQYEEDISKFLNEIFMELTEIYGH